MILGGDLLTRSTSRWWLGLTLVFVLSSCSTSAPEKEDPPDKTPEDTVVVGCDGQEYPSVAEAAYVLPFPPGSTIATGLTNCSSSFHGPGRPDQYAYDFDAPLGTTFLAARAGRVSKVIEGAPSSGGGAGNSVIIDHGDGTSGLYLHSPQNGIIVAVNDEVEQGDPLGLVGRSGLAGYPHLHFIVVSGSPAYPYDGIPVAFLNASPADHPLKGRSQYEIMPY